jgi:hypothetical protein
MAAASHGWAIARAVTPVTVTSSVVLTRTLLAGSGEVLTAARRPALMPCEMRAVTPPVAAPTAASREAVSWPMR